jgi:Sec-independent protein translocase protein TatA
VLALFANLSLPELFVIALAGIMVFGRNLPTIAVKAAAQFSKARRALNKIWRETGVQDEFRRMQREMREAEYEVRDAARRAVDAEIEAGAGETEPKEGDEPSFEGAEHDEHYHSSEELPEDDLGETTDEPEGEAARRAEPHPGPDPYPGDTD